MTDKTKYDYIEGKTYVYDYTDRNNYVYLHALSVLPPGSEDVESEIGKLVNEMRSAARMYGADSPEVKALEDKINALGRDTERAYLDSLGSEESVILEKCESLLKGISKAEFDEFITQQREMILPRVRERQAKEKELGENASEMLRNMNRSDQQMLDEYFNFTFKGAWAYLAGRTYWHQVALMEHEIPLAKYEALLDVYAAAFYKPKRHRSPRSDAAALQEWNNRIYHEQLALQGFFDVPYRPMLQGTPNLMLVTASTKGKAPDKVTGAVTLKISGKGEIKISDFAEIGGELGVTTRKIFDAGCTVLAAQNSYRPAADAPVQNVVAIDLEEYAKANGYDVTPRPCETPKELDREKDRIAGIMHDLRASLRSDLSLLKHSDLSFTDKTGGKSGFYTMGIVSGYGIRNGTIRINFDTDFTRYLTNAYIMNWPTALLLHDNRNPNAYSIGWAIAHHSSIDTNRSKGTDTRLSVESLLAKAPQIQSYEDMTASGNRNWKRIIKKPLEAALDAQIEVGYLSRWAYYDGDNELTREAAAALPWRRYSALMVEFTAAERLPDQTARLTAKAEREAKKAERKPRRKKAPTD